MPMMTAISSQTSKMAGCRADGMIFSPPLPDRDRAATARSSARSIRSASSRSVASQSTTGRGARPSSHGSIQGAAIRPPFRSIAKMSTSAQRASWAISTFSRFDLPEPRRPTIRVAISRSVTAHSWPSSNSPTGIGLLMLSGSSPAAGNGIVSPSTSRSTTCRVTLWAWSPRSKRRDPCRSRAATSSFSVDGARPE